MIQQLSPPAEQNLRVQNDSSRTLRGAKKQRASQACESCRVRKVRCNVNKHGVPCTNCSIDELPCVIGETRRKKRQITNQEVVIPEPSSTTNFNHLHTLALQVETPHLALPNYIKPLPDRFGPDDVTYLRNKGALAIPEYDLRRELLQSYATYMHPLMPLLDLPNFLQVVEHNHGHISLLLFQAVMFSGLATADINILKAAGYTNRRKARRTFFNRIRLLYDLDYEDDPISLVQSLLLMTYWRAELNARKETHHWIEIALSLLQKIGLHRDSEDSASQNLRKRIWWSAYVRDVQIALGTRRATLIHDVDFDVPMLQKEDFDASSAEDLQHLCIEQAKLCLFVSHILATQHGVTGSKGSRRTAALLFPDLSDESLLATDKALREWKDDLPDTLRLNLHGTNTGLVINCAAVHMFYYAGLSCLHRLQLLSPSIRSTRADDSRKALRLAAIKIATIAGTLLSQDLVRYLPSATITVLLPAIVHHIAGALSLEHSPRYRSLQYYSMCIRVMAALRDMYAAADYSTAFLQAAIQRTELGPLPQQTEEDSEAYNALTNTQSLNDVDMEMDSAVSSPGSSSVVVSHPQVTGFMTASDMQNHRSTSLAPTGLPSGLNHIQDHYGQPTTFDAWNVANSQVTGSNDDLSTLQVPFDATLDQEGNFPLSSDWLSSIGAEDLMMTGFDGDDSVF